MEKFNYKEPAKLSRFMSERAKILPRRVTGLCARHQRALTLAIKHVRFLGILPYVNH
ncbi:MAG: 30S ribosomal protein S18 [Oscillospiraceae bacterium]|nr:30S ribosomal protein S18 [Oscillospiraceae bacterium]